MAIGRARSHKYFRLDAAEIKRAQRVLPASTETQAIERALDLVISEFERNRMTAEANERLIQSGIEIKDIYGVLGQCMPPVMFDSSIYIAALRIRTDAALELKRVAGGEPIWLSSVVLEELYAGASVKNRHIVERFR